MKTTLTKFLSVSLIFLFSLLSTQPVFAHGEDARLEISPERLNPGGVLDIRGVSFEPEAEVTLALVGSGREIPLGSMTADPEGVFQLTTTLPADLGEGVYVVRGTTNDDHTLDSAELTVWGIANQGEGEGGPIDEDDTLLAPFPTIAPGQPTPMMSSTSVPITQSSLPTERASPPYPWIAAGIGIALICLLALRLRKT